VVREDGKEWGEEGWGGGVWRLQWGVGEGGRKGGGRGVGRGELGEGWAEEVGGQGGGGAGWRGGAPLVARALNVSSNPIGNLSGIICAEAKMRSD